MGWNHRGSMEHAQGGNMEHATDVAHPAGLSTQCCIVAEVAQAHDGSLGTAHAFIDACARAGADAIKFQTHIAAAESTPGEPWRVKFSRQGASRYDYWKRMAFTDGEGVPVAHTGKMFMVYEQDFWQLSTQ